MKIDQSHCDLMGTVEIFKTIEDTYIAFCNPRQFSFVLPSKLTNADGRSGWEALMNLAKKWRDAGFMD